MPKKKTKTEFVSLPYPYTLIELIPPKVFEEWIKTVKPNVQEAVRRQWAVGRAYLKMEDTPEER